MIGNRLCIKRQAHLKVTVTEIDAANSERSYLEEVMKVASPQNVPSKSSLKRTMKHSGSLMIDTKQRHNVPVLKWLIYPVFGTSHNEIVTVPIGLDVDGGRRIVTLPLRIIQRLLTAVEEKIIISMLLKKAYIMNRV